MEEKYIEITIINSEGSKSEVYKNIQDSVNTYLIKNKGAVSDFNLIKDIVDRNTDTVEEEINAQIPIPLYLGLMGTMLGIVVGLFMIPSVSSDEFSNSVDILISGVKVAMIASFVGLLLTTYLSGWLFKGARNSAESLKNQFFSWIQTTLLPVLSQNTASSIYSLQSNLLKFNDTFSGSVVEFREVLQGIKGSFDSQVTIMEELKKVDVAQLANININVLKELKDSSSKFAIFQDYLNNMNGFVANSRELNATVLKQLDRTNDFVEIAGSLKSASEANKELIALTRNELKQISDRKELLDEQLVDFDSSFKKAYQLFNEQAISTFDELRGTEAMTALRPTIDIYTKEIEDKMGGLISRLDELSTAVHSNVKESNDNMNEMLLVSFNELAKRIEENSSGKHEGQDKILKILLYVFAGTGSIIGIAFIISFLVNYY
ncbi:hypothetical protein VSP20_12555 [Myroides phaeus]|uniref:hypothetical protein n=1 Tax=Myroides phaeus TaxID=702745 RepID=UPI002DBCCE0D|nr:hypothetical protein [Myroides phaeus]MEC4117791.1 hypothetical protein [Myroides phaeus]